MDAKKYQARDTALLLLVTVIVNVNGLPKPYCTDPPNLKHILAEYTHHINPSMTQYPADLTFWRNFYEKVDASVNPECPSEPRQGMDDSVAKRSTCPWYWQGVSNDRMFPVTFSEAKCHSCPSCMDSQAANQCEQVKIQMPALWKTGRVLADGSCEWKGFHYERAVGCTCARPQLR